MTIGLTKLSNLMGGLIRLGRRAASRRNFSISITRLRERSLLAVHGKIDARTSPWFVGSLQEAFTFSARPLVVDLRDAEFADAEAVHFFAAFWEAAARRGMTVEVVLNVGEPLVHAD